MRVGVLVAFQRNPSRYQGAGCPAQPGETRHQQEDATIMGFLSGLALIFIVLKLTEVIAWSWWLVLSPLLAEILLAVVLLFVAVWIRR